MFDVGRICVKLAGRDAGKTCVIVEKIDGTYVMIDGQTRRRKCNVAHLEPTQQKIELTAKAAHEKVVEALDKAGIAVEKKGAKREAKPRQVKQKVKHEKIVKEKKAPKKEAAPQKVATKKEAVPQKNPSSKKK